MTENDNGNDDMSLMDLPSLFFSAKKLQKSLEDRYDYHNPEYKETLRSAIFQYEECKKRVEALALFSTNEGIEDVASNELKYMLIDTYLADMVLKTPQLDIEDRKATILRAKKLYEQFLQLCDSYDLIVKKEDKDLFEALVVHQMTSAEVASKGIVPGDPGKKRETRIRRYKEEKELKGKLETLSQLTTEAGGDEGATNVDEDVIRELYITSLSLSIMRAFQAIEGILLELDILRKAPASNPTATTTTGADVDADRLDHPSIFTNTTSASSAILSSSGKPLRPFTLLDSRNDIRKGVFRPGHNLPTMTIDEYLEEEHRRGNIISGGGEKSGLRPEPDEDDLEKADRETIKAREWDEFKEDNPRGSGNTMNRG